MTFTVTHKLIGGPQDGGKVQRVGYALPCTIYVGRTPMGDGFAAWSEDPSTRFPAEYKMDDDGDMEFLR